MMSGTCLDDVRTREERGMGVMQAVRCRFGHHDWGPILGDIDNPRRECEQCGNVKSVRATAPRGYAGPHASESGFHDGGGGGSH